MDGNACHDVIHNVCPILIAPQEDLDPSNYVSYDSKGILEEQINYGNVIQPGIQSEGTN